MKVRIDSFDPEERIWSEKTIEVIFWDRDLSFDLANLRCWFMEHMVFERAVLLAITLAVIDYWFRRFLG